MNNSDLIKTAMHSMRNDTVLNKGIVELLCNALEKSDAQLHAVVAENVALKSGHLFFMYSDETGFEIHKTQDAALASAKDMIAVCREEAAQDGWPEDADTICWGLIMQKAIEMDFEKPSEQNGWIGWSEYKLTPDIETPATDAAIASLRAESHKDGAIFAANRMLAAWDAGFVEDTPENAADIARAILSMTEFMDDAPEGDFDRSFADEMLAILAAIAAQHRSQSAQVKGVQS